MIFFVGHIILIIHVYGLYCQSFIEEVLYTRRFLKGMNWPDL